jgi:hypothetical protein
VEIFVSYTCTDIFMQIDNRHIRSKSDIQINDSKRRGRKNNLNHYPPRGYARYIVDKYRKGANDVEANRKIGGSTTS